MNFKVGECVRLKSGGPIMTINSIGNKSISCVWFDGKKKFQKNFEPLTLEKVDCAQQNENNN